jgi:Rps23 Pro-64 3,4-dihydroxylase Tpa1-like proline 4-hydroxylase
MSRIIEEIENSVYGTLAGKKDALQSAWNAAEPVKHFVVDDLLPADLVREAAQGFPPVGKMKKLVSIRERKYASADLALWGDATRAVFLALQSKRVLEVMSEITGIPRLQGDPSAYAGGISEMREGDFLNPHLDNSTHPVIKGYRRLNALFYVSDGWTEERGGNLELWSSHLKERKEICSSFNRLVLMNTNRKSLHSVNKVRSPEGARRCVSNYYFTEESPHGKQYHHITSFRGRPDEPVKDAYLRVEAAVASRVQALFGKPLKR